MAEVYLVWPEHTSAASELQVIKVMRSDLPEHERPEYCRMFEDEGRLAIRLNHPHIVHSHEIGIERGQSYIVMEFLEGQSLHHIQQRVRKIGGGFPVGFELFVLCQVLKGLAYAHRLTDYDGNPLHVVHRDISPHNVFVTYSGQGKLLDFGLAKTLDSMTTRAGIVKGKITYTSPEQVRSEPFDHRADLFSVGILVWEALAQRKMHEKLSAYESIEKLVRGDIPKIRDAVPNVDPRLERIVTRALQVDPRARYQDAESFHADLASYVESKFKVRESDVGAAIARLFARERSELNQLIQYTLANAYAQASRGDDTETTVTIVRQPDSTPLPTLAVSDSAATRTRRPRGTGLLTKFGMFSAGTAAVLLSLSWAMYTPSERADVSDSGRAAAQAAAAHAATPPQTAVQLLRELRPETPPVIQLALTVEPAHASIELDGRVLTSNPYVAQEPRDVRSHTLTVKARGYLTVTQTVRFDQDLTLNLQLQKTREDKRSARAGRPTLARLQRTAATQGRSQTSDASDDPFLAMPDAKSKRRTLPKFAKVSLGN